MQSQSNFYPKLKSFLAALLKRKAVKLVLVKILGSAAVAGPLGWILTYITEELFESVGRPLLNRAINAFGYRVDVYEGKKIIIELDKAKDENDNQAYNDTIDDFLS